MDHTYVLSHEGNDVRTINAQHVGVLYGSLAWLRGLLPGAHIATGNFSPAACPTRIRADLVTRVGTRYSLAERVFTTSQIVRLTHGDLLPEARAEYDKLAKLGVAAIELHIKRDESA